MICRALAGRRYRSSCRCLDAGRADRGTAYGGAVHPHGGLGTPAKLANPGYGPAALEHYHRLGVKFDCIYSGYLADAAQAKLVEQAFELWPRAFKVVDPVLGDGGRLYSGLGPTWCPLCIVCAARRI